jgi:biotin transport system substrate-specific component
MVQAVTTNPSPLLADLAVPRDLSGLRGGAAAVDALLVAAAALLTVAAALIVIRLPGTPVPVTGQTFAVLVGGAVLGWKRGMAAQVLYIGAGLLGVPVFSGARFGLDSLLGPTGGYLVGFVVAAGVMGAAARLGAGRRPLVTAVALAVATLAIYAVGAPWLALSTGLGPHAAIEAGVLPFLAGDLLKAGLAGAVLSAGWKTADLLR